MTPAALARRIRRAVLGRRSNLIPGGGNRAMALFGGLFPGVATSSMRKLLYEQLEDIQPGATR